MIKVISPETWKECSEKVHSIVHQTHRHPEFERIDYVLVSNDNTDTYGYITVKEWDKDSVYWDFGGSIPTASSVKVYNALMEAINFTFEKHKKITMHTYNENIPMLKLAMKAGFRIIGIKSIENNIFCELELEKKGD